MFDDLLPSFSQLHNSAFVECLVLRGRKLNQLIFDSLIWIECFSIQMVLKWTEQMWRDPRKRTFEENVKFYRTSDWRNLELDATERRRSISGGFWPPLLIYLIVPLCFPTLFSSPSRAGNRVPSSPAHWVHSYRRKGKRIIMFAINKWWCYCRYRCYF